MSEFNRRDFIKISGIASIGFLGLNNYLNAAGYQIVDLGKKGGYGPLIPDKNKIIDLPHNFSYKVISRMGDKMDDGFLVPGQPDGMATFEGENNRTIIIRNHENSPEQTDKSAFGKNMELLSPNLRSQFYDFGNGVKPCTGGTSTLIYNTKSQEVEAEFLSLAGTIRNCAGGPTPWDSWITCEETTAKADEYLEKDHGYTFEVPVTSRPRLANPIPIKAMGRFNHEAVAVDPATGIVYQTEDVHNGLFYRFIPNKYGRLHEGGRLEALVLKDKAGADTRNWPQTLDKIPMGTSFDVEWISLEDIESPENDLRLRGHEDGAAIFARGEGIWFGDGELYFACTNGGLTQTGQVYRYRPSPLEGQPGEISQPGKLELFAEPNNSNLLEFCDNLTIAPWGDVVLCEDKPESHIMGITAEGKFYKIAKNSGLPSEFAGATFSPDGSTLFVNIQYAGLTLAITGPWLEGYND